MQVKRAGLKAPDEDDIPLKRKRGTQSAVHQFTMRVAIKDSNKFVRYCDKHRLSYREWFERVTGLLDRFDQ